MYLCDSVSKISMEHLYSIFFKKKCDWDDK